MENIRREIEDSIAWYMRTWSKNPTLSEIPIQVMHLAIALKTLAEIPKPELLTVPPDTWISVEERLPENLDDVEVAWGGLRIVAWQRNGVWSTYGNHDVWRLSSDPHRVVTHWRSLRPLPEPPGEG